MYAHAWNGCSQSYRFPTAVQGERSSGNKIGFLHALQAYDDSETDILAITHYPEINIQTFCKLKLAFFLAYSLHELKTLLISNWNGHSCRHALPWNWHPNLFKAEIYMLRKINFLWCFLSYQSPCGRREPILCYNKPRWDFHLKQRPVLAYYKKGSARFIITKTFYCIRYFSKMKSNPAKKTSEQCFLGRTKPMCQNSAIFEHFQKCPKNQGEILACSLSIEIN